LHSPRWTFVYPGLVLLALGLLLVSTLFAGRLTLGESFSLDLRAYLFGCILMLLGMQCLTFGVVTRVLASRTGILPDSSSVKTIVGWTDMNRLLQVAALGFVAAAAGLVVPFIDWGAHGFGEMNNVRLVRGIMLCATVMIGSVQLGLSAFIVGMVELLPCHAAAKR
jgi:hypothetical protein